MATPTSKVYSRDLLRSLDTGAHPPLRAVRKILFRFRLWRPSIARPGTSSCYRPNSSSPSAASPSSSTGLRIATWNIRSLRTKYLAVSDAITAYDLDLLAVTESWHSSPSDVSVRRSTPPGYSLLDCPRSDSSDPDRRGGGIIIYHRDRLRTKKISLRDKPVTFEVLAVSVTSSRGPATVLAIYRPGSTPPTPAFFSELSSLLEQFALHNTQLVVVGDLNLHLEEPALTETIEFNSIAEQFGLKQHVAEPTHRLGGWLDVILTRDDSALTNLTIHPPSLSDHGLVIATIPFLYETLVHVIRYVRGWKKLDHASFGEALRAHPTIADPASMADKSTSDLFAAYEDAMSSLVDSFLPLRPLKVRSNTLSPWFDAECRTLRRQARRLERLYRRTRSQDDRKNWIHFVRQMHARYREREREYWEARIALSAKDPKRLWATYNGLLGRHGAGSRSATPTFSAEEFAEHCCAKIRSVRDDTSGSPPPQFPPTDCSLSTLSEVTPAELRSIILTSASKSCELDPLPTFLVQEFIEDLLPFLTLLCNRSLQEGILPPSQKRSLVFPAVKRDGLDSSDPANYRPISNVSFISKIIEKIVANQLTNYLNANGLLPASQSGFRRDHSTETLLIRLLSDIYGAMDRSQVTLLALFDVSAAFDSVDHDILLLRLSTSFGLSSKPLDWLRSFLCDRTSCVVSGSTRSHWAPAPFGLPQGSVLGPLLYILYTSEIGLLLSSCGVLNQIYADDTQAYVHCPAAKAATAAHSMQLAIDSLGGWMSSNRLRLNPSKTQFIWLGTRQQLAKLDLCALSTQFPLFTFCTSVRDLGVILDQELTFTQHVNSVSRSCFYQLRQLRVISRTLTPSAAATLVHAFVASRLDYCSSLYVGLPQSRIGRLERVLRAAARLIGGIPKSGHVSDYMRDVLHWLPLPQRISFRVSAFVWRSLVGTAPAYLQELCRSISANIGRRPLRSAVRGDLSVPFARTSTMQHRAFSVVGPSIWNGLPLELRLLPRNSSPAFYTSLKTILFSRGWAGSASE